MPYFIDFLLARLAIIFHGLNPVGMQHRDVRCGVSSDESQIPLIHSSWLFLLTNAGFCITLVQRLQGNPIRSPKRRLNWYERCILSKVHKYQQPCCANVLNAHDSHVISVAIHLRMPFMVTGSIGCTKLWFISPDSLTQSCIGILQTQGNSGNHVAFHPNEPIFVSSNGNTAGLYDVSEVRQKYDCMLPPKHNAILVGHRSPITDIKIHQRYPIYMVSTSVDNEARVWEVLPDSKTKSLFVIHDDVVSCVDFHSSELIFVTGSKDCTIRVWSFTSNLSSVTRLFIIFHSSWVKSITFQPNTLIFATGTTRDNVKLWKIFDDFSCVENVLTLKGHNGTVSSVKFNPHAPILVTSDSDRFVRYFLLSPNVRHTKLVGTVLIPSTVLCLEFSQNAQSLVIACEKQVLSLQ